MQRFEFAFDPRFRVPLLAGFGARPGNSDVVLDDDGLTARFGWHRCQTTWDNVLDARITRDYRWFKAIGARGSMVDRGVTYGTNADGGVCICFREPVGAFLNGAVRVHPALTVTVRDLEGLAAAIHERIDA